MPSTKPVILARVDRDIYDKIQAWAKANNRSMSYTVEHFLKKELARPQPSRRGS